MEKRKLKELCGGCVGEGGRSQLRSIHERNWESYEGSHLQRAILEADLQQLVRDKEQAWFSPMSKREKSYYVLKSPHGHRKSGETLKKVSYGIRVIGEASALWGGMGGISEVSRSCRRVGSLRELYGLLQRLW